MTELCASDRAAASRCVFLSNLPPDVADDLLRRMDERAFARGRTIFMQGDPAHHVLIVLEGWVKLYRTTPAGEEAVVGIFTKGQSFGEAVVARGVDYPAAAEAVTDVRLLRLSGAALLEQMRLRPELCPAMLAACYIHLHALVAQLEQLKARTAPQRVADFLADLSRQDAGSADVTLPYDKVLIAGRLGMQPESLSRAFARLRPEGVTVRQNRAIIDDVKRLRAFAENGRRPG